MEYQESPIERRQRQFANNSRKPRKATMEWTEIIAVFTVLGLVALVVGFLFLLST